MILVQENLYITNASGERIAAWILQGDTKPRYFMIICHGFRGAKENSGKLVSFAQRLNQLGIGVMAFDFRGSGESDGAFDSVTLSGQVADLHLVISYTTETFPCPILLLGRSFGGTTVAAAAPYDDNVAGCIFWSAPVDLHSVFSCMLGSQYQHLEQGKTVNLVDLNGEFQLKPDIIKDYKKHDLLSCLVRLGSIPVLAVQGGQDEVVNPDHARVLVSKVKNGELFMVDHADHRFTEYTRERENLTINWIRSNILNDSGGIGCISI
jgi:alpha-beta hydrolase superfamily lysophospholipase